VVERSTPARLAGLRALEIGGARDLDALMAAQATFLDLIVSQQVEDMEHGIPLSNAVVVGRLSRSDGDRLRSALDAVVHLDVLTRDLLFSN
jgi:CBS domain-containing protein